MATYPFSVVVRNKYVGGGGAQPAATVDVGETGDSGSLEGVLQSIGEAKSEQSRGGSVRTTYVRQDMYTCSLTSP